MRTKLLLITLILSIAICGCSQRTAESMVKNNSKPNSLPIVETNSISNVKNLDSLVAPISTKTSLNSENLDLSFPEVFNITKPNDKINTTYESYFITGTSDPLQPVYFEDEEIERKGTRGLFGVLVNLKLGSNTFTFSQGSQLKKVVITRNVPTISKITTIAKNSMYPDFSGGAYSGGELLAECTAPSGSTVSAMFEGNSINLEQVAPASNGVAAVFRGNFVVGTDYDKNKVVNLGKIQYTLKYNGKKTINQSNGDVFIAGENAKLAVEVTDYLGLVYYDIAKTNVFKEKLKQGATDYIVANNNSYYELASGGFLPTSMGLILEGKPNIESEISDISFSSFSNAETYTFHNAKNPTFSINISEGKLAITLYNTTGEQSVPVAASRLFASATSTQYANGVTYTFNQKGKGNLWGYNVAYNGENTVLRVAYKPKSSTDAAKPLSGIKIVLDPGHGGKDPGAPGVAGDSGPNESIINLAYALASKQKLEQKGATVVLTRSSKDEFLELNQRLEFFEKSQADLFISMHHNSIAESADSNKVKGMELYYNTPLTKNTANIIMNYISANINRINRKIQQSYYRVTIIPYAPSFLWELEYLCNPLEFENITTSSEIDRTSTAFAQAIVNVFS